MKKLLLILLLCRITTYAVDLERIAYQTEYRFTIRQAILYTGSISKSIVDSNMSKPGELETSFDCIEKDLGGKK